MKNIFCVVFLWIFSNGLFSQTSSESKYLLINAADRIGFSYLDLTDPYLSPLTYTGLGVNYEHYSAQFFTLNNNKLSKEGRLSGLAGLALNPQYSASMLYAAAKYSWGIYSHLSILQQIQLKIGGNVEADFGYKNLARNINNPVNVDMAVNLNLAAKASYAIPTRGQTIMLYYELETPIIGGMFVPLGGASYFEMFQLGSLSNSIHFSSLHNKLGLTNQFSVAYPFKHCTWQIGIKTSKLKYQANEMLFKRDIYSINIGVKYDLGIFTGRSNVAPKNFISPEN